MALSSPLFDGRIYSNDEGRANPTYVQFKMNQLMTYLFEDLGKSPWTFVILWWLGNIIVDEIERDIEDGGDVEPITFFTNHSRHGRDRR